MGSARELPGLTLGEKRRSDVSGSGISVTMGESKFSWRRGSVRDGGKSTTISYNIWYIVTYTTVYHDTVIHDIKYTVWVRGVRESRRWDERRMTWGSGEGDMGRSDGGGRRVQGDVWVEREGEGG